MMKAEPRISVACEVVIRLTEQEAHALYFASEYGAKEVSDRLSTMSIEFKPEGRHRKGMESLLASIREEIGPILNQATEARAAAMRKTTREAK